MLSRQIYKIGIKSPNALLTGKKQLVKISDEGAKTNCFLSLFNSLLNEAALRQKKQK